MLPSYPEMVEQARQAGCSSLRIPRLEDNLCQLQDELLSHTYHPGQYVFFTIHPGAHPRPVTEGLPFLGFIVFPTHRWLKRRNGIAFTRRYKQLRSAHRTGEISLDQVTASVQGWVNHTRFGDTWGLRRAVLCG